MNGEELYEIYIEANGEWDIAVDEWDALDSQEREIWERMAELAVKKIEAK